MSFGKLGAMGRGMGHLGALGTPGYTAAANALFAAMTTPPTTARKRIINNLIVALQSAGVWSKFDLFYVMAAADSQAARLNWVSPSTFTISAVNSPTFTADRGFNGDGASSFLNTNYVPSSNAVLYAQNSAHLSGWSLSTGAASSTERLLGNTSSTTNRSLILPRNTGDIISCLVNDTAGTTLSNANRDGYFLANRSGTSARQVYRNGSSLGSDVVTSAGLPTTAITFLKDVTNFATLQVSCGSVGASLNSTEVSALYSALLTYHQAVGAA
jgi:hypothetical protein